jgi:hypothetical protein
VVIAGRLGLEPVVSDATLTLPATASRRVWANRLYKSAYVLDESREAAYPLCSTYSDLFAAWTSRRISIHLI